MSRGVTTLKTLTLALILMGAAPPSPLPLSPRSGGKGGGPGARGRPIFAPFSGAIGSFQVDTRAMPGEVIIEEPVLFTIHITASAPVVAPPQRPDLKEFPDFADAFFIEDIPDKDSPQDDSWDFLYRLKPRELSVKSIPAFPLIYFRPDIAPPSLGYMTRWAAAIPLTVKPRPQTASGSRPAFILPDDAPDSVKTFIEDQGILTASYHPFPSALMLVIALALPVIVCVGWLIIWRGLHPDAAGMTRRRRSRASGRALKKLRELSRLPYPAQAQALSHLLANYLRQRFQLPSAEPTPGEVYTHLLNLSISESLAQRAYELFKHFDSVRFGAGEAPVDDVPRSPITVNSKLIDESQQLIVDLEEASCSS